jgi:hypothetical protein
MKRLEHTVSMKVTLHFVGYGHNVQDALDNALAQIKKSGQAYDLRKGPKIVHHGIVEVDDSSVVQHA